MQSVKHSTYNLQKPVQWKENYDKKKTSFDRYN